MKKKIEMPFLDKEGIIGYCDDEVTAYPEMMEWMQQVTDAINGEDEYKGEVGGMWQANYCLIKNGDKTLCAWCEKDIKEIKNLNEHLEDHEKEDKQEDECDCNSGKKFEIKGFKIYDDESDYEKSIRLQCERACGYKDKQISLSAVKELVRGVKKDERWNRSDFYKNHENVRYNEALDDLLEKLEEL